MIKLRAWDEETKTYYRNIFDSEPLIRLTSDNRIIVCIEYPDHIQELQPLLFTGALDKNGQEIYEGDIVGPCIFACHNYGNCEIIFHDLSFCVKVEDKFKTCIGRYYCEDLKVIGNKFEHPELLEQI